MKITAPRFLALFSLLLITWAFVYSDALIGMEAIWRRSDTFAHGYFILPISLWLLWRDKTNLLTSYTQTTWLPLPILIGSLFVWLLAYAADINVLGQLSAVISLICLVWLMVGNKLMWRYKFPFAYLLFAVPMGENLIPWLQDITAWFTVSFLKLNGIPVFSDGLYIQIPNGMFEVAVACSGIRYLIASLAVGTLFAYLTYNSIKKQAVFIAFSLVLPILANGIRAYGIVAIAYYSDMKYGKGVDHLIYGWLFFGLVIMLMFWIGGKFADPEVNSSPSSIEQTSAENKIHLVPVLLVVSFFFISYSVISRLTPVVSEQPTSVLLATETLKNSDLANWEINFIAPIRESKFELNSKGSHFAIELYLADYANKQDKGELINDLNDLYGKGWTIVDSHLLSIVIDKKKAQLNLLKLTNVIGQKRLVLYSYIVGNQITASESKIKIYQALGALLKTNDFGRVVAVSSTYNDNEKAELGLLLTKLLVENVSWTQVDNHAE